MVCITFKSHFILQELNVSVVFLGSTQTVMAETVTKDNLFTVETYSLVSLRLFEGRALMKISEPKGADIRNFAVNV